MKKIITALFMIFLLQTGFSAVNALQIDVPMSLRTYVLMSLQSKVQVPLKIMVWLFSQTFVLKR